MISFVSQKDAIISSILLAKQGRASERDEIVSSIHPGKPGRRPHNFEIKCDEVKKSEAIYSALPWLQATQAKKKFPKPALRIFHRSHPQNQL